MKKLITICAASIALAACAKGHSLDPIANAKAASEMKDLQGNHVADCKAASLGGTVGVQTAFINSSQESYKVEGKNVDHIFTYFTDTKCQNKAYDIDEAGTVDKTKVMSADSTQDASKAKYVKFNYDKLTLTANTPDAQNYVQKSSICNLTKVSVNSAATVNPKDASASSCLGDKVELRYNAYSTAEKDGKKYLVIASAKGGKDEKSAPTSGQSLTDSVWLSK